jgi:hypothetical protein
MKCTLALAVSLTAGMVMGGCSQAPKMSSVVSQPALQMADASPSTGSGDALGMTQYAHHELARGPVVSAVVWRR